MKNTIFRSAATVCLMFVFAVGAVAKIGACHEGGSHDIVDTAVQSGQFKTFAAALNAAGLVETLKGNGPFTVFAPTDEAFAKLPEGTVEDLLKPENKEQLVAILTYHVVAGQVLAKDVVTLDSATTVQGTDVAIVADSKGVKINVARVTATDVMASNGVIHVIDQVLLPPESPTKKEACRALINRAIHLGVPMYNRGDHAACAAIYEVTSMSLMSFAAEEMPAETRNQLSAAMKKAKETHDPDQRAWIYRRGLDTVNQAMSVE